MQDSVTVVLSAPVKYGPENKETTFVEVRCPSYETGGQKRYGRDLKAMLSSIIVEEGRRQSTDDVKAASGDDATSNEETPAFTPGLVLMTVSAALGTEFSKAVDRFCEHAQFFCFLGGEEAVKGGTLSRMHPDDVDMLFCTFIANFIMPSLLKSLHGRE